MRQQVLLFFFVISAEFVFGQVSYSIPEEMAIGSFVGNVAQDLGLDLKRLKTGKARLHVGNTAEYVVLNKGNGLLLTKERNDREALCRHTTPCALHFQIILENPIEFYRVTVEITDINDNAPFFKMDEMLFEISESAVGGATFVLEKAFDSDVGMNGLKSYLLSPTDNFMLKLSDNVDGEKEVEMVLEKPLDREKQEQMTLILTAVDGGEPQLSGTVRIRITVLDVNDNAPVFTQSVYKASLMENSSKGTLLLTVIATDVDQGINGIVTYSILSKTEGNLDLFEINNTNGQVYLTGQIDYETSKHYQLQVKAKDHGGLSASCKIIFDIIDVNDNSPVIDLMSTTQSLPEDCAFHTVVAVMDVQDADSENNGVVKCILSYNEAFTLENTSNGFYRVLTNSELDRERSSEYNITVTCSDEGVPSLSSSVTLTLQISDVNDNVPVFDKSSYEAYIVENNTPGLSIFTVKATDADWNQNTRVSYILEDSSVNGVSVSSYVSVSADSGVIHAVRSLDYEQIKDFQFRIKAQDGGSPPLSSNVTVKIVIQDQNDNAPQVLYPVQTGGSVVAEMVPRSADVGYMVTKVVAVDVDSGQNAWLSYKLQKTTDRALFEVGLQNGEIRTIRQVTDKDAVKQRLTVFVEDNGQPSRSATVIVNVVVADSYPEVLSEFTDFTHDKEYNDNLTFYLVLALAVVSFLFITCLVVIISVKIYRWQQSRILYHSSLPVIPYYPPRYSDTLGTGTLPHVYNYEVCRMTDSRKSDCKFGTAGSQNVLIMDPSSTGTMQGIQSEKNILDEPDSPPEQKPPNNAWLSYKLQKATDRALFEVGLQNGEIRTIRQVTDKDAVKQRLTVFVEDNGQPSRSATVIVNVAVADSYPEVLSEFSDFTHDKEYNDNLTFYLVLALAVVSFLFITCLVVIISVKIYRWRQSRILYHSSLPVIPYYPPRYSDTLGTGTLPHVYNYEVCRTTDSRKSDCKFGTAGSQNVLIMDTSSTGTMQRIQSEKNILDEPDSPLEQKPPNNDWRFTQGQRPGPSGPNMQYATHIRWTPKSVKRATGGPEVAMGTGPWPQPPTEAEQLQALMAAANEVSEATATLGPGTMGLSTRYSPQFTLQHVPDYRQNVYIPGSTATLTSNPQQQATAQQATQQALPPPQAAAQPEPPKAAQTPASKKKSTKKEKK
ncbi:protocadherin beta-8-like isoform X1 [Thalassophryne amazonica]|uniref:protocadherin beta-8-like isoform X1 n=1 Tax=Thalassophryne amazonica TaxID=390379 RepID=UPI001470BA59|nr:protocadherin beta-8-like isoform X1 [Thalassophryne amazonica]